MGSMRVLHTIHGSRLYGTHHENSDWDWYTVVPGKVKPHQTIVNGKDSVVIGLDPFLSLCGKGVPQALEALWSPVASVDPLYASLLRSFRPSRGAVVVHRRTALSQAHGDHKRRRHALRIAHNTLQLWEHGNYDPTVLPNNLGIAQSVEETNEFLASFFHALN